MEPYYIIGLLFLPLDILPIILSSFLILLFSNFFTNITAHIFLAISSVPFFYNLLKNRNYKLLLYEMLYLFLCYYIAMILFTNVFYVFSFMSIIFLVEKDIRNKTFIFVIMDYF